MFLVTVCVCRRGEVVETDGEMVDGTRSSALNLHTLYLLLTAPAFSIPQRFPFLYVRIFFYC